MLSRKIDGQMVNTAGDVSERNLLFQTQRRLVGLLRARAASVQIKGSGNNDREVSPHANHSMLLGSLSITLHRGPLVPCTWHERPPAKMKSALIRPLRRRQHILKPPQCLRNERNSSTSVRFNG